MLITDKIQLGGREESTVEQGIKKKSKTDDE